MGAEGVARPACTVRYFAAARERAGVVSERIELPEGARAVEVLALVTARHPSLAPLLPHLRVAVNQEFVERDAPVPSGAEVALIPPVAGGSGLFQVVERALSLDEVVRAVGGEAFGGLVTFSGCVRGETRGRRVVKLEYEAYPGMAEKELARIGAEVASRWPATRLAMVHRVGTLVPGELAVVIASAAAHRKEAFAGCAYALERLKESVPIWKKEHFEDGAVWVGLGP